MTLMQVSCPAGAHSGMKIPIRTADGREFEVVVPNGVKEGDIFHIEIPDAPTATATAVPVAQGVPVSDGHSPAPNYPGASAYPSRPHYAEQPVNVHHVVVNDPYGPQYVREQYCGPISCLICLFVPCGFWIALCPIDERIRRVA
mmetsp:Transcript_8164/g.11778  ORF Transcript_8164/g.11778 Transcript_8164/m.11778 type:complete len:144 (+) Transcript_8164:27-458(+)